MNWNLIISVSAITILIRTEELEGKVKSIPLLSDDLQVLLNSLYDSGYLPEYLQEELSESEKASGDYLEFPDFNNSLSNAEYLNHPSWMSYQKEMFVPPESEYKNIAAHKVDKSHEKLAPFVNPANVLWDQLWRKPFIDPQELRAELLAPFADNFSGNISRNANESLNFLLPIPEKGRLVEAPESKKPLLINAPSTEKAPKLDAQQKPVVNLEHTSQNNNSASEQLLVNANQIKREESLSNIIASRQPMINSNLSSPETLQAANNETQGLKTGITEGVNNIQSHQNSFKNPKIIKMQEVQVAENPRVQNTEVALNVKETIENLKKNVTNKKKIFSFLNVFRKGAKHSDLNSLNNHSSETSKELLGKGKPATLQELYNQLIDERNLYERNNMLRSRNEEAREILSKLNPEEIDVYRKEADPLEVAYKDKGESILNEAKIKMPQILYQKKRKK